MTSFVGLLKYNEPGQRSSENSLKTGRAARAAAEMEGQGAQFLSILWAESDYDMVLVLEARDQQVATNVFKRIEDAEQVSVELMPALVKWEKELLVRGKSLK